MYKSTKRKLQKKAIYNWQQDMDKFIVFPLSWGFFNVEEWSLVQQFRPYWTLYWHPFPGAILSVNGTDFEPDPETIYLFPLIPNIQVNTINHLFSSQFIFWQNHHLTGS